MVLFFGTRPGKQVLRAIDGVACPYCSQTGTLTACMQPNYFHLFWIPLFKVGTYCFVECAHCRKVYFKEGFTPQMEKAVQSIFFGQQHS